MSQYASQIIEEISGRTINQASQSSVKQQMRPVLSQGKTAQGRAIALQEGGDGNPQHIPLSAPIGNTQAMGAIFPLPGRSALLAY